MEQMQILLAILVLLPFVSALLLALCGSDRMRRLIVYGSAGVLMISAVAFAVCFFSGENLQLRFLQSGGEGLIICTKIRSSRPALRC